MAYNSVSLIEKTLTYVDGAMRWRLAKHGLEDIDHILRGCRAGWCRHHSRQLCA
jgi:hypothetical protein